MMNMVTSTSSCCYSQILLFALISLILKIFSYSQLVEAYGAKVEFLPGFEGPLPFELETGYVGLGETDDDLQVFYYFIKSENNPQKDPLILWLTGGPGCSSFSALVAQIGPFKFKIEEYNGSLPTLVYRPQSWTKVSSIIFADLPFGTGFSYAKNATAHRSDWKLVHHTHQFLRKWLIDHPEFISNEFYFGGDSYSGIPGPAIVQEISNGNVKGLQPWVNLQGYVLGNPLTTRKEDNDQIQFAHGMGLISDELYLALQSNCKGNIIDIDSRNELCLRDKQYYDKCLSGLDLYDTLYIYCEDISANKHELLCRRSLSEMLNTHPSSHLRETVPDISCPIFIYFLSNQWANNQTVREALHVREGVGKWRRCYKSNFEKEIHSSFEFHVNLSAKGYRSLIYSGDHDAVIPFISTQAWIRSLNYSIVDDWRSWLVNYQVAGYTRTYSNQMTFATIKGAGHIPSMSKPDEGFAMFTRWISNIPL